MLVLGGKNGDIGEWRLHSGLSECLLYGVRCSDGHEEFTQDWMWRDCVDVFEVDRES